jgi:hypothetical protein
MKESWVGGIEGWEEICISPGRCLEAGNQSDELLLLLGVRG